MTQSAPDKAYRKGISLIELMRRFPDDAIAERWIVEVRWPNGVRCARCNSDRVQEGTSHPTMPYRCRDCRKFFSVRTGTAMESSKLSYQVWVLATYLMTTGTKDNSSMKLHRDLNVTQKHAWHLAHRIREAWEENTHSFTGPAVIDETYVGGREKDRHESQQRGERGHGGKSIVVGMEGRPPNKVSMQMVEAKDGEAPQGSVRERLGPSATLHSDEHAGYKALRRDYGHLPLHLSVGDYVLFDVHTNGMGSGWSLRGYIGTYRHWSAKHLRRYVGEFAGRHGQRPMDTIAQMRAILRGMVGQRLRYQDLIA